MGGQEPAARPTTDPLRWIPRYHITAEQNWLNDPNGAIYLNGRYHLFYQYNPDAPAWGPPRWAHVSSADLVHWHRQGIALEPDDDGPDRDGCWSGCVRVLDGSPAIYYTGVIGDDSSRIESICRARGTTDLSAWVKDPGNPLVPAPPAALGSSFHRDPYLWRDHNGWHLLVGSGRARPERHGCLGVYHSPDGASWRYDGIFLDGHRLGGTLDFGTLWECPQLLQAGDSAILLVSCQNPDAPQPFLHTAYIVGHLEGYRFRPRATGLIDHGDAFYAATAGHDSEGRPLILGWARETRAAEVTATMAKVGALSLPRMLRLDGDQVKTAPVPQLARLRTTVRQAAGAVDPQVRGVGLQFEVEASIGGTGGRASLDFGPPGSGALVVSVDMARLRLEVSTSTGQQMHAPITPAPAASRTLRVYGDGSLIEVFFGGEAAFTTRWYRTATHCDVTATSSGHASVTDVTAWNLIRDAVTG